MSKMNSTIPPTQLSKKWLEFMNRCTATIAVETSILLLIGLIAIGGNLLVVNSIYRNPSLRTTTNYFVLSLAVSDILYPVLCLPLSLVSSALSRFDLDTGFCKFQGIVSVILLNLSVYTIVLMAVNRFVCVCRPHRYVKWFSKKACLIMICGGWLIYFVVGILVIEEGNVVYVNFFPRNIMCSLSRSEKTLKTKLVGNINVALAILIPFVIITCSYYKVFKKIREHKRNIAPTASNPNSLGTSVQEIKVTWVLFAVLLGFCLNWVPVLVAMLIGSHNKNIPRQIFLISTYGTASSSAINPFIYGLMNRAFRKEYKKVLKCQRN